MYNSILLPIDLEHDSSWKKLSSTAVNMAKQSNAKIHVLTVIPDYGMSVVGSFFPADFADKALEASKEKLDEFAAANIPSEMLGEVRAVSGTVYERIMNIAEELGCDLIVMASHRPSTADYLLGPNAARVVRHANQSVLVVRD